MPKEKPIPTVDWMQKKDLDTILKIDESNHAWNAWGRDYFLKELRKKNIIGLSSKIYDVVAAFCVYEITEKEFIFHKFEVAPELRTTRAGHVILEEMKRKAKKYKKSLSGVFWEGETIEKFQFFAKNGFKSGLEKNFFLESQPFTPDGIKFSWILAENENFGTDSDAEMP